MNTQAMTEHFIFLTLLKKYQLSKELTRLYPDKIGIQDLLNKDVIARWQAASWIKDANSATQIRLLLDAKFYNFVNEIMKDGYFIKKIEDLYTKVGDEMLRHEPGLVREMLQWIPNEFWATYLKYYSPNELTIEQKKRLVSGLRNFSRTSLGGTTFLQANRLLLCTEIVSGTYLQKLPLPDYVKCLQWLSAKPPFLEVMETIVKNVDIQFTKEQIWSIQENVEAITPYLNNLLTYLEAEKELRRTFLWLWLGNQAPLYDLVKMADKIAKGMTLPECRDMLKDKSSYIGSFYHLNFPEKIKGKKKEDLLIYAIAHHKKAFLSLVRENFSLFNSLPDSFVLFSPIFYTTLVNLNTIQIKSLLSPAVKNHCKDQALECLTGQERTFTEVVTVCFQPERYIKLYAALEMTSVDKKLIVIREVIKQQCLDDDMDILQIAKQLSVKPLSQWMQQDFAGIQDLDARVGMRLLACYEAVKHLISDIRTIGEARYVTNNSMDICNKISMEEVRKTLLIQNSDWNFLKKEFQLNDIFIQKYEDQIKTFLYEDGAHIMGTYLRRNPSKKESLRRLTVAELMGRFSELKYFGNDLSKELNFPVTNQQKEVWITRESVQEGDMIAWEEDGLLPVMKIGVVPERTCLSYQGGMYQQYLLACHDANKKVIYLSYQGKIVLRAAIRLTKGEGGSRYEETEEPALEFADLQKSVQTPKMNLTLFLERSYQAGLSAQLGPKAEQLLLRLMQKKAKALNATLLISADYRYLESLKGIKRVCYSLYISKSKAGGQYLDSLGGACQIYQEGKYYNGTFLISQK